jgi:hypothetical protein
MNPIVAIAVFTNDIAGYVKFTEEEDTVRIDVNIRIKTKFVAWVSRS